MEFLVLLAASHYGHCGVGVHIGKPGDNSLSPAVNDFGQICYGIYVYAVRYSGDLLPLYKHGNLFPFKIYVFNKNLSHFLLFGHNLRIYLLFC